MAEKDEEINTLMRRIHLETKNFKAQLCNEQKKYKMLCQKLGNVTTRVHVPITTNSGDETYKVCCVDIAITANILSFWNCI